MIRLIYCCPQLQDQFQLAMQLLGREFTRRVMEYKDIWLPTKAIVQRALESRFLVIYNKFW